MERFLERRWFHAVVLAVLCAAVIAAYSGAFNAGFHFDDIPQIVENYTIRDLKNLPRIILSSRGLTVATFALNYAVGGMGPKGFHVVNILIHAANGILVYFLVFNTLFTVSGDSPWSKKISAYSAFLFALHPVQTQAVTYIVQRMESLASLFYLLALLAFIKGAGASTSLKRLVFYAGVVLFYILSFKSKEIAITLPALVVFYDIWFVAPKGGLKSRLPLYGVLFLLLVYFVAATIVPLGGFGDLSAQLSGQFQSIPAATGPATTGVGAPTAGFGVKGISPFEYLLTQFNVLIYYIALLFVPINQNLDYDFPVSRGLFEVPQVKQGTVLNIPLPPPVISLLILLFIIGAGVYLFMKSRGNPLSKRASAISFFIFWFFIILSPTSSFIPVVDVIFEHRVYLASLGFFVIFAICFDWFFEWLGRGRGGASES